jgi:hypothetical protein
MDRLTLNLFFHLEVSSNVIVDFNGNTFSENKVMNESSPVIICSFASVLLPPYRFNRHTRSLRKHLTIILVNKIWKICHNNYIIGNLI